MEILEQKPTERKHFVRRLYQNNIVRIFSAALALLLSIAFYSLGSAILKNSTDPISAKVAEWGRDHDLGFVVTRFEQWQYQLNPPKVGGTVAPGILKPINKAQLLDVQPTLRAIATPALPGEGEFKVVLKSKSGLPLIETAYIRPDAIHTSYLASVVWMSGSRTRIEQRPGFADPGVFTGWKTSDSISRSANSGIIATFNGGFKMKDSRGGMYQNGVTKGVMQNGAATLVTYQDGHTDIGMWGRDFKMAPNIVSARQNLKLLIDNGKIASNINSAVESNWGATLGWKNYVWRTGIGITRTGDFVYVIGNALSASSLANLLLEAGAVRAMQMDINPMWVSYMYYTPAPNGLLNAVKVAPFDRPATRYFQPSSRDFFVVYQR